MSTPQGRIHMEVAAISKPRWSGSKFKTRCGSWKRGAAPGPGSRGALSCLLVGPTGQRQRIDSRVYIFPGTSFPTNLPMARRQDGTRGLDAHSLPYP
jgi:hypothetical protein